MKTYIVERYLKEGGRRVCTIIAPTAKQAIDSASKMFGASDDWDVICDSAVSEAYNGGILWSTIVKH